MSSENFMNEDNVEKSQYVPINTSNGLDDDYSSVWSDWIPEEGNDPSVTDYHAFLFGEGSGSGGESTWIDVDTDSDNDGIISPSHLNADDSEDKIENVASRLGKYLTPGNLAKVTLDWGGAD